MSIGLKGNADGSGAIQIGGTDVIYLDTAGEMGLGVTPSAWGSEHAAFQLGFSGAIQSYKAGTTAEYLSVISNAYNDNANWRYIRDGAATRYELNEGVHRWFTSASGTAGNAITFTQAMTLDASGNLLVATTNSTLTADAGIRIGYAGATAGALFCTKSETTNASTTMGVYSTGASAYRFYVGMAGTVFATTTTISAISDQRFKENVRDLDVGLDAVMALKPRKFDWKEGKGPNTKDARGFIAQEFEQVFPDLIDEWADPAPEGEEPYKSVRQDLIPVLVKAIQEQQAIITDLQTRLAALEAK